MWPLTRKRKKSALIRMDMRGPSRAADCLDGVVAFPVAVEQMRAASDDSSLAETMISATRIAFDALEDTDHEALLFVAASAQDLLYRYILQLTMMDRYTRSYCDRPIRYFFEQLTQRGLVTFYILDNTLREDRFQAVLELFELSGIITVTPRRDGIAWGALASRLRAGMNSSRHVAYIEPDAVVDHIAAAKELAVERPCVATFRNLAPSDPEHEIVNFKAARA